PALPESRCQNVWSSYPPFTNRNRIAQRAERMARIQPEHRTWKHTNKPEAFHYPQQVDPHIVTLCALRYASLSPVAQSWIALTICVYPVHRQRLPRIYSRTSFSEGFGFSSNRAFPMTTMPGVQNPHWTAPCLRNDSCRGWSSPLG